MSGYNANLKDQREIYIPKWPATVAFENLSRASQYLGGADAVVAISELNIPAVIVAICDSKEPEQTAALIKHFVCEVRMDNGKLTPSQFDSMFETELDVAVEIFAHVVKAQYADFFESGLAKAPSPSK